MFYFDSGIPTQKLFELRDLMLDTDSQDDMGEDVDVRNSNLYHCLCTEIARRIL